MDKISTGSKPLDKLLAGGYEKGVISTLYGAAGTGKSNFCMLAALTAARQAWKVIYIDSVLPEQPVLVRQKGKTRMVKMGELIDSYFDGNKQGSKDVGDLYCLSMRKDGQIRWSKVKRVYRHWNTKPKYRFVLKNGLWVETTSAHSIITVKNRGKKFRVKLSKDISLTDRFVAPFWLSADDGRNLKTLNTAEYIDEDRALSGRRTTIRKRLRVIKLTDSFVKFLGWYLAEGYICFKKGEGLTRLYLNKETDREGFKVVKSVAKKLGLRCDIYKRNTDCMVSISSMSLALLMKGLFKGAGAKKKRVPDIVYDMSKRQQEIFLDAWIKGDYGSSVNPEMISDICYLGFMVGRRYSIYESKRKGVVNIGERKINLNSIYAIAGNKIALKNGLIRKRRIGDTMLLKIKRIEQFKRSCMVYDLCVDEDETFIAGSGGIVLHNTEGGFSVERASQLFPREHKELMANVLFLNPTSFEEQRAAFDQIKDAAERSRLGLVIVDSMVMLYRLNLGDSGKDTSETNRELARQLRLLSEIARKKNVAVLVTNQVYADFGKRDDVRMVGGDLLKYWSKCIVKLERISEEVGGSGEAGPCYRAAVYKHRSLPAGRSVCFEIREKEIVEASELRKKFSLF